MPDEKQPLATASSEAPDAVAGSQTMPNERAPLPAATSPISDERLPKTTDSTVLAPAPNTSDAFSFLGTQGANLPRYTEGQPQAFNVSFGALPKEAALLTSLSPDIQKQLLSGAANFANKQLDLAAKQFDQTVEADEKDKAREHSKWLYNYTFAFVVVALAVAGTVALYVAGKDNDAQKLLFAVMSFAGGFALGRGSKGKGESKDDH